MSESNLKWEYDKDSDAYNLFFMPYYEWELIATVYYDDGWCYSSALIRADGDYLGSDDLENAKSDVLDLIEECYQDKINYYEEELRHFKKARTSNEL